MNLPRGRRIVSEKIADIGTVYDKIPEDFRGAVRIFMKFEGRLHRGDILVDDGNILCVSLDDLDKNTSVYGEKVFGEIEKMIPEAIGDVDIHEFTDTEMSLALSANETILLRPALPFDRFRELASVPTGKPGKPGKEVEKPGKPGKEVEKPGKPGKEVEKPGKEVVEVKKKPKEEEEWMKELGKLDEEWDKLKDEWEKLESIKGLSIDSGETEAHEPEEKAEDLSDEDKGILKSKPSLVKNVGFADKLRLLRFPNASGALGLLDGKKTVEEIADDLSIDKKSLIALMKELTKRGYVQ